MIALSDIKITKSVLAILKASESLFWKHGIRRITVEEICENAGVSKMTFYRNFTNKFELAYLILGQKFREGSHVYDEIMCSKVPYRKKILNLLEFKKSSSQNVSMELLKDIYSEDLYYTELRKFVEKYQQEFILKLKDDFTEAQKEGHIRPDMKVEFIIHMLNNINHLMADIGLLEMFDSTEELAMNLTKFFFYGILENDEKQ